MTGEKRERPAVPREQGGVESERAGQELAEHGESGDAARRQAEEVERELDATRDDERRQWRGSTPNERTLEKALELRVGEEEA